MSRTKVLLIVWCLLGCAHAFAGEPPHAPAAASFVDRAKKAMMADPASALVDARKAEQLTRQIAETTVRTETQATSLWLEAEALSRLSRTGEARTVLDRAIRLVGGDRRETALDGQLALSQARIADSAGDIALSLKSYQRAYDILARLGDARGQSIALQGLGGIYDEAHAFDREVAYYRKASQIYSADPALELSAKNNAGFALQQQGRYDDALADFGRALDLATALKSDLLRAQILTNIAYVRAKLHKFTEAQAAANEALRILGTRDDSGEAPFAWGVKAEIEYERGALDAAQSDIERAFKGVDIAKTTPPFRDMHEIASRIYAARGAYVLAFEHLKAFKRLDDEGRSLAASANLALMGAQFDFATQQLEIEHLRAEQLKRDMSLRESRAATQKIVFLGILLIGLIVIGWIGWQYVLAHRHRRELTGTLAERDVEIERRIETERQLRVAMEAAEQASRAKSHFLANVSHELRTPLNAIIGFSEILALGFMPASKATEYAKDINASGQNLLTILNDILDMASIDAGTLKLVDEEIGISELIDGSIADVGADRRIAKKPIDVDRMMDHLHVRGDGKRLRQILVSLLSNAVKFSGDDARIAVHAEPVPDGIDIIVSDNGIGIPPDKLELIMEPFGQAEGAYARLHGGVGLGLPIVKSLVQLHGGRFTMTSEIDHGTVARVHLPMDRVLNARVSRSSLHAAQ